MKKSAHVLCGAVMNNKKHTAQSAFFNLRILITLLLCAVAACSLVNRPLLAFFRPEASTNDSQRTLTFAERVTYQRAIEEVYWRHRIWPKERLDPKPSLDAVMSQAQLEKKVAGYLRNSQALEDYWQRPITAEQLQAEMERMAETPNNPKFCGNCLRRWETIPLSSLSVWPGRYWLSVTSPLPNRHAVTGRLASEGANRKTLRAKLTTCFPQYRMRRLMHP